MDNFAQGLASDPTGILEDDQVNNTQASAFLAVAQADYPQHGAEIPSMSSNHLNGTALTPNTASPETSSGLLATPTSFDQNSGIIRRTASSPVRSIQSSAFFEGTLIQGQSPERIGSVPPSLPSNNLEPLRNGFRRPGSVPPILDRLSPNQLFQLGHRPKSPTLTPSRQQLATPPTSQARLATNSYISPSTFLLTPIPVQTPQAALLRQPSPKFTFQEQHNVQSRPALQTQSNDPPTVLFQPLPPPAPPLPETGKIVPQAPSQRMAGNLKLTTFQQSAVDIFKPHIRYYVLFRNAYPTHDETEALWNARLPSVIPNAPAYFDPSMLREVASSFPGTLILVTNALLGTQKDSKSAMPYR